MIAHRTGRIGQELPNDDGAQHQADTTANTRANDDTEVGTTLLGRGGDKRRSVVARGIGGLASQRIALAHLDAILTHQRTPALLVRTTASVGSDRFAHLRHARRIRDAGNRRQCGRGGRHELLTRLTFEASVGAVARETRRANAAVAARRRALWLRCRAQHASEARERTVAHVRDALAAV